MRRLKAYRKQLCLCVLLLLSGMIYLLCRVGEISKFGGLDIISAESLEAMTEGMRFIEEPEHAERFLTLQGQKAAYDKRSHTFYVSQSVYEDEVALLFEVPVSTIRLCVEKDAYVGDVEGAMQAGHRFQIWMIGEHEYTICGMIFTGAPVLSVNSDDVLRSDYQKGGVVLFDPDDEEVNGVSIRSSRAYVKYNANAGTYSVKLTKKLSLLGIGKNKTWKLYEVSKTDRSLARAKLAADLWNVMNAGTTLVRRYEFVEVIENNVYKGLYLLAPKWSSSMLSLSDKERVVSREALASEETQAVLSLVSDRSLSRYYLFLQVAYAYKNGTEDYVVIEKMLDNGAKDCLLAPDKLRHAFGGFEKRLHYLTWEGGGSGNNTSHMLLSLEEIEAAKGREEAVLWRLSSIDWQRLRTTALGDESIRRQLALYKRYFIQSGLAVRCVEDDAFGHYYGLFEVYVTERMAYMDEFFGDSGGAIS